MKNKRQLALLLALLHGGHQSVAYSEQPGTVPFTVVTPATIVEESDQIDESEARYNIARTYLWKPETFQEAERQVRKLLKMKPNDPKVKLLYARLMLKGKNYKAANDIAESLSDIKTSDVYFLVDLAGFQAELGYALKSRELFELARQHVSTAAETFYNENYAKARELWGDWVDSGMVLEPLASGARPGTRQKMDLAILYQRSNRNPLAEEIYLQALAFDPESKAIYELVQLKMGENNYRDAYALLRAFPLWRQDEVAYKTLSARLAYQIGHYPEAYEIFLHLAERSDVPYEKADMFASAARAKLKEFQWEEALVLFEKARALTPYNITSRFYLRVLRYGYCGLVEDLLALRMPPQEINEWVSLLADEGRISEAIELLKECTANYPSYFSGWWRLAELYSVLYFYDEALGIYDYLLSLFPDSQMVFLQKARCTSWMKRYGEALCLYTDLTGQDPRNETFVLEKARVALWDHDPILAAATYELLVDDTSYCRKEPYFFCDPSVNLYTLWSTPPYHGFWGQWADYLVQRGTLLEMAAKFALWNNLPFTALCRYQELLAFAPGRMETMFEYAQTLQGLGLNCAAGAIYSEMLALNRNYSIAADASSRIAYLEEPKIADNVAVWSEQGYGVLSQITRTKVCTGIEYPLDGQSQFVCCYYLFSDHPFTHSLEYKFQGVGVSYEQTVDARWSVKGSILPKIPINYQLKHYFLGGVEAKYRVNDVLVATVGSDRVDEFYNYFGIKQGIQSTSAWGRVNWQVFRNLHAEALYRHLWYTDSNNLDFAGVSVDWRVTEYPKILKLAFQGEYRNTQKTNIYIYQGDKLVDIIHPYWAPQDYYAGRLVVEWIHDLTRIDFIGAEKTRYVLRATVGDDTDDNWAGALAGEFHHDWGGRWSFEVSGLGHYSRLWKAAGVWSKISYAF